MEIHTPTDLFEAAASAVAESIPEPDDRWTASHFRWFRELTSRRKGAAGERIIDAWLTSLGFVVTRPGTSQADRRVNGYRIEVKSSTEWDDGQFTFQQIRDQDYKTLILLGITPESASIWIVPKEVAFEHARGQHTGAGSSETSWISFPAATPPSWLAPYGGDLSRAAQVAQEQLASPDTPL